MMKIKVIEEGLTRNGADIPVGEIIEIDEVSGAFHVKNGIAVGIGKDGKEIAPEADSATLVQAGQIDAPKTSDPVPPNAGDELTKIVKAIDGVLKKEALTEEAQALGISFAFDATKNDIIVAAVNQGMENQLLESAKRRAAEDRAAADAIAAAANKTDVDAE